MKKTVTDICAAGFLFLALATGFNLHSEVHHLYIYNDISLWTIHEVSGLLLVVAVLFHSLQHSYWFKNYRRLKADRRRVTTILLAFGVLVAISGLLLMFGSRSNFISLFHYVTATAFTLIAIGHVAKRWKIFRALLLPTSRQ